MVPKQIENWLYHPYQYYHVKLYIKRYIWRKFRAFSLNIHGYMATSFKSLKKHSNFDDFFLCGLRGTLTRCALMYYIFHMWQYLEFLFDIFSMDKHAIIQAIGTSIITWNIPSKYSNSVVKIDSISLDIHYLVEVHQLYFQQRQHQVILYL